MSDKLRFLKQKHNKKSIGNNINHKTFNSYKTCLHII